MSTSEISIADAGVSALKWDQVQNIHVLGCKLQHMLHWSTDGLNLRNPLVILYHVDLFFSRSPFERHT